MDYTIKIEADTVYQLIRDLQITNEIRGRFCSTVIMPLELFFRLEYECLDNGLLYFDKLVKDRHIFGMKIVIADVNNVYLGYSP